MLRARAALMLGADREGRERDVARSHVLARHLPANGVGAEIGVHKGRFTKHLLETLSPRELHLIDPWYLGGLEWSWGGGDRSTANALAAIVKRYSNELARRQLVIDVGYDLDVLRSYADATFDWVYLDSTHQYEHTQAELRLLQAKVKPGGFISGDDWQVDTSHKHHGVFRAVKEFVEARPAQLVYAGEDDLQWVVRLSP
ncbi:MAG: class I SAM-dependent methyltransferase [Acidimicrobiales bacterium]